MQLTSMLEPTPIRQMKKTGEIERIVGLYGPSVNGSLPNRRIDAAFWKKMEDLTAVLTADPQEKVRNPGFGLPEGMAGRQAGYIRLPMTAQGRLELFKAAARETVERLETAQKNGGRFVDPELRDFLRLSEPALKDLLKGQDGKALELDKGAKQLIRNAQKMGMLVDVQTEKEGRYSC